MSRLHPRSKRQLEALAAAAPHAILLHGLKGSGVLTAANELAARLADAAYIHEIMPEKTGITIEQIRNLYVMTRTSAAAPRVFVLQSSDQMSHPAQTAFLKLLEEPTSHTTFLLVSQLAERLLPTIHSRVQAVEILPLESGQTQELLDELGVSDPRMRAQLVFIADGLPDELAQLANDEQYRNSQFELAKAAKGLIAGTLFDKLKAAHSLVNERSRALAAVQISARMLAAEIARMPDSVALLKRLQAALRAQEALTANGSVRAQLLRFVMVS